MLNEQYAGVHPTKSSKGQYGIGKLPSPYPQYPYWVHLAKPSPNLSAVPSQIQSTFAPPLIHKLSAWDIPPQHHYIQKTRHGPNQEGPRKRDRTLSQVHTKRGEWHHHFNPGKSNFPRLGTVGPGGVQPGTRECTTVTALQFTKGQRDYIGHTVDCNTTTLHRCRPTMSNRETALWTSR